MNLWLDRDTLLTIGCHLLMLFGENSSEVRRRFRAVPGQQGQRAVNDPAPPSIRVT
jgi:hypothetical protein